jgi:hypothetical protein
MRDKLNKSARNNVTKLLTKLHINDTLSFDNPYESMLDDVMTKGLKLSETNKGTFYNLTDEVIFVIPDKLESCYNGSPMTIFTLIVDNFTFMSRDTKTWSAQGFGQVNINEDLTDNQEYEAISKFATNTDLHRNLLIKRYNANKEATEEVIKIQKELVIKIQKELVGKQLVDAKGNTKGYQFTEEGLKKGEDYLQFINQCIDDLKDQLPSEVADKLNKYRKDNKV